MRQKRASKPQKSTPNATKGSEYATFCSGSVETAHGAVHAGLNDANERGSFNPAIGGNATLIASSGPSEFESSRR